MFLTCMGFLGNVHDAEDIAQDAMIKGFVEIKKLRDGSQFRPWIIRIAKNMCINKAKRKKHIRKALEEKAMHLNQKDTQNDNLQQAIERLPKEVRLPLVMYYFDGQNVKTVAERLNISTPGVYLKLRNGIRQLHELLVKQGDAG